MCKIRKTDYSASFLLTSQEVDYPNLLPCKDTKYIRYIKQNHDKKRE